MNDQLVARGETVFALGHLVGWEQELQLANRDRRGRPLLYPDMVIEFFCELLIALGLGFRFAEGASRALLGMVGIPCPDYTTIFRRCQKRDLEEMGRKAVKDMLATCPAVTCVSADSSGRSTSVRGEWLGYRYHLKRKFLKVHVVVDTHNCFPIS